MQIRQIFKGLIVLLLFCSPIGLFGISNQQNWDCNSSTFKSHNMALESAHLYLQIDDSEKAIEILKSELVACEDSSAHSYLNFNLGMAYLNWGKCSKALPFLKEFEKYHQNSYDSSAASEANIALAKYYYLLKDYTKASSILLQTLNTQALTTDSILQAKAFLGLAKVGVQTGSLSEAKSYAQKALTTSISLNRNDLMINCFNVFSDLYEKMGDYQSALFYRNKSTHLHDSILKEATLSLLAKRKINEPIDNDTNQLINPDRKDKLVLSNMFSKDEDRSLYWLSISLLFLFALVFFILFRSKVVLSKKLRAKNRELEKLNATKDKFFSIIAHDLKSPFNSLMGFSEVLSLQVENKSPREIMEYSRSIHNSTRKLYSLVETLLQWSRTQLGTTEYKPDKVDVKIATSNVISILKINAEEKDIVISMDVERDLIAWADKDLFSAVLRNLVSNAIKFSRVGSVIRVVGKSKGSYIEMSVTDTGVGISKANLQKIFKVDTNHSTVGTLNEKGTGLGLVLCKEFVEINKGVISAESRLEKGSVFKFTVPLSANYSLN